LGNSPFFCVYFDFCFGNTSEIKKKIEKLNTNYDIEICEERTEAIGHLKRTHYLLRRKKN